MLILQKQRKAFHLDQQGDLLHLSEFTGAARWFVGEEPNVWLIIFPFQLSLEYNSQVQDAKRVFFTHYCSKV